MSHSTKLTPAMKKTITSDWKSAFPGLGIYKPMWLLKRHGPLVIGLILDRTSSNDEYVPTFHVFNLMGSCEWGSMILRRTLPHKRDPMLEEHIKLEKHKELLTGSTAKMAEIVPELNLTELSLLRVVEMYHEHIVRNKRYLAATCGEWIFEDIVLLSYWGGHEEYADRVLGEASEVMHAWRARSIKREPFDVPSWRSSIEQRLHRGLMETVVRDRLKFWKLSQLPVCELIPNLPPERTIVEVYREILSGQ